MKKLLTLVVLAMTPLMAFAGSEMVYLNAGVPTVVSTTAPLPMSGSMSVTGTVTTSDVAGGSVGAGVAGTKSLLIGGTYNSTLPVLTTGQQASLQLDTDGSLRVRVTEGTLGTAVDRTGTITLGGTSQTLAPALATRIHFEIQNPPDSTGQGIAAAENLCFNFTAAASNIAAVRCLTPGQSYNMDVPGFVSTEAITVWAATTGHRWFAREF